MLLKAYPLLLAIEQLVTVPSNGGNKTALFAALRLNTAAQSADHAVDAGIINIALGFRPHRLGDFVFAYYTSPILIEEPEQIKLFDTEGRIEHCPINKDLTRRLFNAQPWLADSNERGCGEGGDGSWKRYRVDAN